MNCATRGEACLGMLGKSHERGQSLCKSPSVKAKRSPWATIFSRRMGREKLFGLEAELLQDVTFEG
jgi:hypothetical protein